MPPAGGSRRCRRDRRPQRAATGACGFKPVRRKSEPPVYQRAWPGIARARFKRGTCVSQRMARPRPDPPACIETGPTPSGSTGAATRSCSHSCPAASSTLRVTEVDLDVRRHGEPSVRRELHPPIPRQRGHQSGRQGRPGRPWSTPRRPRWCLCSPAAPTARRAMAFDQRRDVGVTCPPSAGPLPSGPGPPRSATSAGRARMETASAMPRVRCRARVA